MPNVKLIVSKHNKTVLDPLVNSRERTCNCVSKEKCPLQGKCLTSNFMYKAPLTLNRDTYKHKIYCGITETKFKQRHAIRVRSLRHEKHQSDAEFLNELWSIKNSNYTPNVVWEILRKHQPHNPSIKRCSLSLNEKFEIARYKGHNPLNKRSEIISNCLHWDKLMLVIYDRKDWIKFSITAFEQPYLRNYSFQKSDLFHEFMKSTRFRESVFLKNFQILEFENCESELCIYIIHM